MAEKPTIAIAAGDPAGIGPEIALKTALDPSVRSACSPLVVCDTRLLERHAQMCGIKAELHAVNRAADADFSGAHVNVLDCPIDGAIELGRTSAAAGIASIAFCRAAVKAALAGGVDAVVGAPQNETSIAQAKIP